MRFRTAMTLALAAAAAGLALADTRPGRPVLHEDLTPPGGEHPQPMIGGGDGTNPNAIIAGDKTLVKPNVESDPSRSRDEPVLQAGMDRETSEMPNRQTGKDDTLHYVSVFNPDVLPFKRMSSLDGIDDDYRMVIAHSATTEVPVGGTTDKSRDRFWGSVLIKLTPGSAVPLPSVAPDMRILSYEVKPSLPLHFEKDGADNFFVRSDESSASGTYRLVFLCDADAGYFAPSLPTGRYMTPAMVLAGTPSELRPVVPARVRRAAEHTLERLGIDSNTELGIAFNKLVADFRSFSAKALPASSGDIYRDLCESHAGVCRHRAFAFMVTANAIGIPTRYVSNEAHAFVEVYFPGRKWQRIDLGGAALRMEVSGAENKTLHRPRSEDPFSKPPEYTHNTTDYAGLTKQQMDDKQRSLDQAPPSGAFGNNGGGPTNAAPQDRLIPDPGVPAVTFDPKKQVVKLTVTQADSSAYRGNSIHIEGVANANGKPIPDHLIEIFLAPAGSGGANHVSLGNAMTAQDGSFKIDLTVPSMSLAVYDIILMSPEDAYYNAARSD